MRETLLACMAAAITFGASAAIPAQTFKSVNPLAKSQRVVRAPEKAAISHKVIFEAPEGETKLYSADFEGLFINFNSMAYEDFANKGWRVEVVYCDNEEVYVRYLLSDMNVGLPTYVKGHIEGDRIVFANMQCTGGYSDDDEDWGDEDENWEDEDWEFYSASSRSEEEGEDDDEWTYGPNGTYCYLAVMKYDPALGEDYAYIPDSSITEFSYQVDGDVLTLDLPQGYALCQCYEDGTWMGSAMRQQQLTLFDQQFLDLPLGVEPQRWVLSGSADARFVNVAFDGQDLYIGNIDTECDGYVKATINGDKVILPGGQYIGINEEYNYFTFVTPGKLVRYTLPDGTIEYDYDKIEELTLNYDAQAKTMTSDPKEGLFVTLGNADYIYYLNDFAPVTIKWVDPEAKPARPNAPIITNVELGSMFGNVLDFDLPKTDVNGNLLDIERMYYNFFVDGDLFTFYPDEYFTLDEEMTDIPYTFSDWFSFYIIGGESPRHSILFFFEDADEIGLQQFYVTEEGEILASDYTIYALSGVKGISTDKAVVATEWFDLMGRKINEPVSGMAIRMDVFSDGSCKASKIAK